MGGKRGVLVLGGRGVGMMRSWWRGRVVAIEVAGEGCGYGIEDAHFDLGMLGRWNGLYDGG